MPEPTPHPWSTLLHLAAWSALVSAALIPVQISLAVVWPPPSTGAQALALFHSAGPLPGLIATDALYLFDNVLILPVYLALAVVLWQRARSLAALGLLFGAVGMAVLIASNRSVELWQVAHLAGSPPEPRFTAVADALIGTWKGTGYVVYYWLNALALFAFAVPLTRQQILGRAAGPFALAAAVLMLVPATFGTIGLVLAVLSLIPWTVFCVLIWRHLRRHAAAPSPTTCT